MFGHTGHVTQRSYPGNFHREIKTTKRTLSTEWESLKEIYQGT